MACIGVRPCATFTEAAIRDEGNGTYEGKLVSGPAIASPYNEHEQLVEADQRFQAALDQAIATGSERIKAVEATVHLKSAAMMGNSYASAMIRRFSSNSALSISPRLLQVDPWAKAADCERAMRISIDPTQRENLANIREFWISLANARPFLSEREFAIEAETIARFQSKL